MNETESLLKALLCNDAPFDRIRYEDANVDVTGTPNPESTRFFITHFPKDQAALARVGEDGSAERFESYVDGIELTNGFCELIDPVEQRRRFKLEAEERKAEEKTVFPIDEGLLTALSSIKTSYYGNALGLDRVLMVKYRKSDINDVQVFPADERY
jgi:lysyl-tRNA synthetase class 2